MQFPWACLSAKEKYSRIIRQSFSSPMQYVSVKEERQYTKKALRIVIEARLKKKILLQVGDENAVSRLDSEPVPIPHSGRSRDISRRSSMVKSSSKAATGTRMRRTNVQNETVGNEVLGISRAETEKSPTFYRPTHVRDNSNLSRKKAFYITAELLDLKTLQKNMTREEYSMMVKRNQGQLPSVNDSRSFMNSPTRINANMALTEILKRRSTKPRLIDWESMFLKRSSTGEVDIVTSSLPMLKLNLERHTNQEIEILQEKNLILTKQFNELASTCKQLAHKLKTLKSVEINTGNILTDIGDKDNLDKKIEELSTKLETIAHEYKETKAYQVRLQKVIQACHENQKQNEKWIRSLNLLLQNFKKVIEYEKKKIKAFEQEIKEVNRLKVVILQQRREKNKFEKLLMQKVQDNFNDKRKIDHLFEITDEKIEMAAQQQSMKLRYEFLKDHMERDQVEAEAAQKKTEKKFHDKWEIIEEDYHKLSEIFDLKEGENISNNKKYLEFIQNFKTSKDLENVVIERETEIRRLREQYTRFNEILETYKIAKNEESMEKTAIQSNDTSINMSIDKLNEKVRTSKFYSEEADRIYERNRAYSFECTNALLNIAKRVNIDVGNKLEGEIPKSFFEELALNLQNKLVFVRKRISDEAYRRLLRGDPNLKITSKGLDFSGLMFPKINR
eukprot:TRINITY_DN4449_c0_g2_i8.p1 TRINITY_DN4449_c0_g2~~TRINITY_DN4449_c0_g2_i8.p1  ORF type:complete len:675 (+),score=165.01 TRINITY_DN4449_c0_g2_i8:168-2192(+)